MTEPKIADKKPSVIDLEPGTYWWCACGLSAGQPFCDGSHKGTGLTPMKIEVSGSARRALCNCKHTHGAPDCDGSHKTLP
ncbi:MAG TPA: CDGSH iron-sulfur domain-containing protein [Thermoanaerobaculia bacterium]|nr:CDGSH iron-sulfur domain-containing protein [Thermoanaerobaculia bacterium]HUM29260.1 CDGSH iron-sulfur domain-containing protein [Thermoanaerobaculia bacterium]HXK67782.1 CDGSH iron-sulfur domain-containing protein [Thermoanaerobaculia bacterium]